MKKLSVELNDLVNSNPFLLQGIREKLFNASALSRMLKPLLMARLKRELSSSAISMALTRLSEDLKATSNQRKQLKARFSTQEIAVRSNLELLSYPQSSATRQALERLYRKFQKKELFATLTEGMREITFIFERNDYTNELLELGRPLLHKRGIGCIAIYFPKEYGSTPGFLYMVFQQLYFQGINVIEIASTSHELLVYVDEKDLQLGFDTIYHRFVV